MSKEFVEINRKLGSQYPFDTFILENDDYQIKIYYLGDYENDKANGLLDSQKFTIENRVKPKSICLDLVIIKAEDIFIRMKLIDYLEVDRVDEAIDSLRETKENIKYIKEAIERYCSNS